MGKRIYTTPSLAFPPAPRGVCSFCSSSGGVLSVARKCTSQVIACKPTGTSPSIAIVPQTWTLTLPCFA